MILYSYTANKNINFLKTKKESCWKNLFSSKLNYFLNSEDKKYLIYLTYL